MRTLALYRYGMAFAAEYRRLKTQRGLLDYQDLIDCTNRLLQDSDVAAWVAWKLDNGIQHLLIDEAQDTSPAQWRLLRHLADAFFDDAPSPDSNTPNRSVFADRKNTSVGRVAFWLRRIIKKGVSQMPQQSPLRGAGILCLVYQQMLNTVIKLPGHPCGGITVL